MTILMEKCVQCLTQGIAPGYRTFHNGDDKDDILTHPSYKLKKGEELL